MLKIDFTTLGGKGVKEKIANNLKWISSFWVTLIYHVSREKKKNMHIIKAYVHLHA